MISHDHLCPVYLSHVHVREIGRYGKIVEVNDMRTEKVQELFETRYGCGCTGINRAALLPVYQRRQHMNLSVCVLVNACGLSLFACLMKSDG